MGQLTRCGLRGGPCRGPRRSASRRMNATPPEPALGTGVLEPASRKAAGPGRCKADLRRVRSGRILRLMHVTDRERGRVGKRLIVAFVYALHERADGKQFSKRAGGPCEFRGRSATRWRVEPTATQRRRSSRVRASRADRGARGAAARPGQRLRRGHEPRDAARVSSVGRDITPPRGLPAGRPQPLPAPARRGPACPGR